jgi:hypothetical protein
MAHSYFVVGETEEGISAAGAFIQKELDMEISSNPNVMIFRYGLLSVDDARRIRSLAELSPTDGQQKALIISASRLFHEAQNALLKLFEEPPQGTLLILVIPTEGILLPTLRSRLLLLPSDEKKNSIHYAVSPATFAFLTVSKAEREKLVTKMIDRTKSDKDEEKQAARLAAIQLVEGLIGTTYKSWNSEKNGEKQKSLQMTLKDLNTFLPILHERSAPMKLIFEHIQMTLPEGIKA